MQPERVPLILISVMICFTIIVMKTHGRYRVPPTKSLIAFESAARHRSFSRAAEELGTFQSAISRQIATLEKWVSTRVFDRSSAGVTLTDAGSRLREAIATGLDVIHRGVAEAEEFSRDEQVVIACSNEIAQYLLLPSYNKLCEMLGEHVRVRILTYQMDVAHLPPVPVADVMLTWNTALADPQFRVPIAREAVRPVSSPDYAAAHADILNGPVAGWGELTFVDLARPNEGWASWDDWFSVAGTPKQTPRFLGLDCYDFVLEAAADGRGIALGWDLCIERHLAEGTLVELGEEYIEFGNHLFCALTPKGRGKPLAHKCLSFFEPGRTETIDA